MEMESPQASSQNRALETSKIMREVQVRMERFKAYSQETVELMQHIHPEPTRASHDNQDQAVTQEKFSIIKAVTLVVSAAALVPDTISAVTGAIDTAREG